MMVVPAVEAAVGLMLVVGFHTRLASLASAGIMLVATYVHLTVHSPELFPLQPQAPIIPLVALGVLAYLLRRGGGSWSADLRATSS